MKSLLSNGYYIFWVYVSFVIFTYRKLQAKKNEKISFHFVSVECPKKVWENFRLSIVEVWSFPYKIVFQNCFYDFWLLSCCKLNKMNILILIITLSKLLQFKKIDS